MIRILTLLSILLFSQLGLAYSCVEGSWKLDVDNSDDAERMIKKLERKEKKERQLQARPVRGEQEASAPIRLPFDLPEFVFSTEDIGWVKATDFVQISQGKSLREFNTKGQSRNVNLSTLQSEGDSVIAGWEIEDRKLVVETTTITGLHIKETFQLQDAGNLQQQIQVTDRLGLSFHIEKNYKRELFQKQACQNVTPL